MKIASRTPATTPAVHAHPVSQLEAELERFRRRSCDGGDAGPPGGLW